MQHSIQKLKEVLLRREQDQISKDILNVLIKALALYTMESHDRWCDAYGDWQNPCTCFRGQIRADIKAALEKAKVKIPDERS